jgi:hypothetical protein
MIGDRQTLARLRLAYKESGFSSICTHQETRLWPLTKLIPAPVCVHKSLRIGGHFVVENKGVASRNETCRKDFFRKQLQSPAQSLIHTTR